MKRNLIFLSFLLISALLLTPASGARQEHVRLVLKNAKHTFTATLNPAGYFVFSGVKPGTYQFSLVAPKNFFDANTDITMPITFHNMVWNSVGYKSAYVTNMTLPDIVLTGASLTKPVPSNMKDRSYSLILNPALTTVSVADLSGYISNMPKGEY